MVSARPTWCISRQRVWGTPIPALVDKSGNSYISKELVEHVADLIAKNGADVWWTCSVPDLLTDKVVKSMNLPSVDDLSKGTDIMDVWMDSGVAWHCARKAYDDASPERPTDGVLEGVDQFRGWFQSLLLTSVAVQDALPYKRVHVHGFCVDDNNRKMSKSLGNVVDPETVTDGSLRQKALGADGLRLWVALAGGESVGESKIGDKVLADVELKWILRQSHRFGARCVENYRQYRFRSVALDILHFAQRTLSAHYISLVRDRLYCSRVGSDEHIAAQFTLHSAILPLLDQWILRQSHQFGARCVENYRQYRFRSVALDILHFAQRTLSAHYISLVRDRLYCSRVGSDEHIAAQFTLHRVGSTLAKCMAPILPHLSAEFFQHQPSCENKLVLREVLNFEEGEGVELHADLDTIMEKVLSLRSELAAAAGPSCDLFKKRFTLWVYRSNGIADRSSPAVRLLVGFLVAALVAGAVVDLKMKSSADRDQI
ncbi:unnamed protein product [Nippostrongylus brasiliensis]|uniref:Isoleucyl-tRNA synthetase n=1 Tax=Nippostrongylus brasiliensis TaxID=27835 RepID=A0A0N4YWS4_NIPBR|nr:unnamed protein product [Nippostrongylus brasiliensis]